MSPTQQLTCEHCQVGISNTSINCLSITRGTICSACLDLYDLCIDCNLYVLRFNSFEDYEDNIRCPGCYEFFSENQDIEYRSPIATNELLDIYSLGDIVKSNRKFGIELECFTESEKNIKKILNDKRFKVIGLGSDSSIRGSNGVEWRTPPVSGNKGEQLVKDFCTSLVEQGFKTNKSCGFHLHIDGSGITNSLNDKVDHRQEILDYLTRTNPEMSPETIYSHVQRISDEDVRTNFGQITGLESKIKKLFCFYLAYESVILSFLPPSRRANQYCRPLSTSYHIQEIIDANSNDDIERIWYRESQKERLLSFKGNNQHQTRRKGINIHSLLAQGHIEIRFHSGTVNPRKVLEWINLHTRILDVVEEISINYEELLAISFSLSMSEKTDSFFKKLGLSKESESYFRARQEKFKDLPTILVSDELKKEMEEILSDETEDTGGLSRAALTSITYSI